MIETKFNDFFREITKITEQFQLVSLQREIDIIELLFEQHKNIDVVILGQFKTGKSSFINSLLERNVLPTGVVPVTSIITRIQFGEIERILITYLDNKTEEITIEQIENFVSELKNPENYKNVLYLDIELPVLAPYQGIRLIDTPGIGSSFKHNTETTINWLPDAEIALITVNAVQPLSENEITLLKEISIYSPKVGILLTKVDLLNNEQVQELIQYLKITLKKEFNKDFDIYYYSIFKEIEKYKEVIKNKLFMPLLNNKQDEIEKIIIHKIKALADHCLSYLEIAYQKSLQKLKEKNEINDIFSDKQLNFDFINKDIELITQDYKGNIRSQIEKIIEVYKDSLIDKIEEKFKIEFDKWNLNLNHLTRKFESWINEILSQELGGILLNENDKLQEIITRVKQYLSFYLKSFKEKLNKSLLQAYGVQILSEEWQIKADLIEKPDISISGTFDFHLDSLWFLFPMIVFKSVFKKYFQNKIPWEIEKNLSRLNSDLRDIINQKIDSLQEQTLKYIITELDTIKNLLSKKIDDPEIYLSYIAFLKDYAG